MRDLTLSWRRSLSYNGLVSICRDLRHARVILHKKAEFFLFNTIYTGTTCWKIIKTTPVFQILLFDNILISLCSCIFDETKPVTDLLKSNWISGKSAGIISVVKLKFYKKLSMMFCLEYPKIFEKVVFKITFGLLLLLLPIEYIRWSFLCKNS